MRDFYAVLRFFHGGHRDGDYSYTAIHWVSFAAVAAVAVALALVAGSKRISGRAKDATIISVAAFQLVFEVGWRILYLFKGNSFCLYGPFIPATWRIFFCRSLCSSKTSV